MLTKDKGRQRICPFKTFLKLRTRRNLYKGWCGWYYENYFEINANLAGSGKVSQAFDTPSSS